LHAFINLQCANKINILYRKIAKLNLQLNIRTYNKINKKKYDVYLFFIYFFIYLFFKKFKFFKIYFIICFYSNKCVSEKIRKGHRWHHAQLCFLSQSWESLSPFMLLASTGFIIIPVTRMCAFRTSSVARRTSFLPIH